MLNIKGFKIKYNFNMGYYFIPFIFKNFLSTDMLCIYIRKEGVTPRKSINVKDLQAAVSAVLDADSLKGTAKSHNVNVMTLKPYVKKQKAQE